MVSTKIAKVFRLDDDPFVAETVVACLRFAPAHGTGLQVRLSPDESRAVRVSFRIIARRIRKLERTLKEL
jgi:hypothetical protein